MGAVHAPGTMVLLTRLAKVAFRRSDAQQLGMSMRWFVAHYLRSKDDARDWRVSPLRAPSLAGLPPALIVTAGFDPLRDEGEMYAGRLRDAGVMVDYVCYGGMVHGFAGMGKLIDTAQRVVSLIGDTLRQALR